MNTQTQFKPFSGLDYLKIDIANAAGQDKLLFEERIRWFDENISEEVVTMTPEEIASYVAEFNPEDVDSKDLFFTGLLAYKDTFYGRPTGYRCQLDAICSGASLMSCLTADEQGLLNTGLLGNKRSDLYTAVYNTMKSLYQGSLIYSRQDIKAATMTFLYGSSAEPKRVFNNDSTVIDTFYQAVQTEANGAYELQQLLTNNWNSNATFHHWSLPDGFDAHIPVIVENQYTAILEVDDGSELQIPFVLKTEGTKKHSVSNCANLVHSIDAMLVREMARRCMYNEAQVQQALYFLMNTSDEYAQVPSQKELEKEGIFGDLIALYEGSKFCSVRIIDYINNQYDTYKLSKQHRTKLIDILQHMVKHGYIEMTAIHDCYTAHANNMNYIRYWYKEMCADLVESNMLVFMYNQVTNHKIHDIVTPAYRKELADEVRNSNYGLS